MRVPDDFDVYCYLVYNPVRTFVFGVQRYEKNYKNERGFEKKA